MGELSVKECTWSTPGSNCASHAQDAIVFCSSGAPGPSEGSLRLISADGAPGASGRLEVLLSGEWAPVCTEGFTAGSASVACKSMGFSGSTNVEPASCASIGADSCSSTPPHMSQLACAGGERSVLDCGYESGDNVFCAANEGVVVSCAGAGDAQGRAKKSPPPHLSA